MESKNMGLRNINSKEKTLMQLISICIFGNWKMPSGLYMNFQKNQKRHKNPFSLEELL